MQEKAHSAQGRGEDQIDEEKLIKQLIEKKKRELEEKKAQQAAAAATAAISQGNDTYTGPDGTNIDGSMNQPGTFNHYNGLNGEHSESLSNA